MFYTCQQNCERPEISKTLMAMNKQEEHWTKKKVTDVMYQTLALVFHHVSKHRARKLKNEAQPSLLTKVRGVWNMIKH